MAALCRWFAQRGYSVAPFKPQNMALNSAVTVDGGEIGRSTALQALACGIEPHSDMNPVLLKPQTDMGAQVIIRGQVLGNMQALDYHAYKKTARDAVLAAWQDLSSRFDVIIVEGAGSPAEINLRDNDIANMGFAEMVDCPVILVADIDRGGVFAHLTGTLDLLSESEQRRTLGFVINRFRGDLSLLQGGLDWLEARLSGRDYLCGEQVTEADWRLFTTLVRFDAVYHYHFKCNLRRIRDYAGLHGLMQRLLSVPGVAETVHLDHIKQHYFGSHETINPTGIVPAGPADPL